MQPASGTAAGKEGVTLHIIAKGPKFAFDYLQLLAPIIPALCIPAELPQADRPPQS
jgi:hypothetical protein